MLQITIDSVETWNEEQECFIESKRQELQLEHSLVSLSKWESKWEKPFLDKRDKTREEILDYVRCMTTTQNVNPDLYSLLSPKNLEDINEYINRPMTATTFSRVQQTTINREVITSEIIYYWMVTFNIPFECQKWHLNRLLTLINVCNIKNQPSKKVSKRELLSRNAALNNARRASLNTSG